MGSLYESPPLTEESSSHQNNYNETEDDKHINKKDDKNLFTEQSPSSNDALHSSNDSNSLRSNASILPSSCQAQDTTSVELDKTATKSEADIAANRDDDEWKSSLKIKLPTLRPLLLRERSVSFGSTSVLGGPSQHSISSSTSPSVSSTTASSPMVATSIYGKCNAEEAALGGKGDDDDINFIKEEEEDMRSRHRVLNDAIHNKANLTKIKELIQECYTAVKSSMDQHIGLPACSFYTPVLVTSCSFHDEKYAQTSTMAILSVISSNQKVCNNNENHSCNKNLNPFLARTNSIRLKQFIDAFDPENGYTALHWAAAMGYDDVVEKLCELGANTNVCCLEKETPLHRASRLGNISIIRTLISRFGAFSVLPNRKGFLPIDVAGDLCTDISPDKSKQVRLRVRNAFLELSPQCRTLILHHEDCLGHRTVESHQESVLRIPAILDELRSKTFNEHELLFVDDFPQASVDDISSAHSREYVEFVFGLSRHIESQTPRTRKKPHAFTPKLQAQLLKVSKKNIKPEDSCDTSFSEGSLQAALRAAGSVMYAVRRVVRNESRNAFCVVRPPGHHAGYNGHVEGSVSCGFCLFNSVVVGAMYALNHHHEIIKKVAIIDIDVHHGNGTEDILKTIDRPDEVFFASTHLYGDGFYPGSGICDNIEHNIINLPITPMWLCSEVNSTNDCDFTGRSSFRRQIVSRLLPALRAFSPDIVFVSAGFDGCKHDIGNKRNGDRAGPVGLDLTKDDYAWVIEQIKLIANIVCGGRVILVLEGGYGKTLRGRPLSELCRKDLASNVAATVQSLLGTKPSSVTSLAVTSKRYSSSARASKMLMQSNSNNGVPVRQSGRVPKRKHR